MLAQAPDTLGKILSPALELFARFDACLRLVVGLFFDRCDAEGAIFRAQAFKPIPHSRRRSDVVFVVAEDRVQNRLILCFPPTLILDNAVARVRDIAATATPVDLLEVFQRVSFGRRLQPLSHDLVEVDEPMLA